MRTVLEGKKVLLTRPKEQFAEWAARLSAMGAIPVSFPLIEIQPIRGNDETRHILSNLDSYGWVIFTSINAAKYFIALSNFPRLS